MATWFQLKRDKLAKQASIYHHGSNKRWGEDDTAKAGKRVVHAPKPETIEPSDGVVVVRVALGKRKVKRWRTEATYDQWGTYTGRREVVAA